MSGPPTRDGGQYVAIGQEGVFRDTVMAIRNELTVDGLVLRYKVEETDDGFSGEEGTFTALLTTPTAFVDSGLAALYGVTYGGDGALVRTKRCMPIARCSIGR